MLELMERQKQFDAVIEKKTEELMGLRLECVCGKTHTVPIDYLAVKPSSLGEVKPQLDRLEISGRGIVVYDRKIEETVVVEVLRRLSAGGIKLNGFPVGDGKTLIPAEIDIAKDIAREIGESADYLVSIGSGVVSDLVKYAAFILEKPYILIATAPSMNGYTSSMAALTDKNIKKTLMVPPARAIFADTGILMNAPVEMVRSGLGDIVSKSICNADWKLSEIVKKTYYCPLPFRITDKSEPLYLGAAEEIGRRTEHGISILTDGVMRSGLSMTVIGTSTPSSGAEHVISHYWDLIALTEGKKKHFHGVQVGVATIMMLRFYDFVRSYPVRKKISLEKLARSSPTRADLLQHIEKRFALYADGVKEEFFQKYVDWKGRKKELELVLDGWEKLWQELNPFIKPAKPIEDALKKSGAAVHYRDLGKSREEAIDALLNASFIRGRYTILDLAGDLGILKEAAEKVL